MPRGPKINYLLRPNKNVERKLIVEALLAMRPQLGLDSYCYLGMGSLWFIDFQMIHRQLGITDMVSMELPELVERAKFNRPFSCIEVVEGFSGSVLVDRPLETKRHLVWLDHEKGLEDQAVLDDCRALAERACTGSVVIVTLNADKRFLNDPDSRGTGHHRGRVARLERLVGDLAPPSITPDALGARGFPPLVATIVLNCINHAMTSAGRSESFLQLFNLSYKDGTPMVTVGGIIVDEALREELETTLDAMALDQVRFQGEAQLQIQVPQLTQREKAALDRFLPNPKLDHSDLEGKLGFTLGGRELGGYRRFYLQYPLFGEMIW